MILCLIGCHNFYVGRWGRGIIYFITGGFVMIGFVVDLIPLFAGKFKDKNGRYLNNAKKYVLKCKLEETRKNQAAWARGDRA